MKPQVSVVVPINGVEGQVRECIESLARQTLGNVEIIAINDASTDNCGRILAELEATVPGLRVVTNETAVGPGPCRNQGIALATGDYIGFVDGDDWVSDDFYEAALSAAVRGNADVVIIDHVRAFPDGSMEPNRSSQVLRSAPTGGFHLIEHPGLLRNIPTVWNKLFRRSFISRPEFRFDTGWYEDVPVTNLALCTAERIAVANTGTYFYRQRPSSILFSQDDSGHLVVLDRYRLLVDELRRRAVDPQILRELFAYSLWHLRLVSNRGLTRFTQSGLEELRIGVADYVQSNDDLYSPELLEEADLTWHRRLADGETSSPRYRALLGGFRRRARKRLRTAKKRLRAEKIRRKREFYYGRALKQPLVPQRVAFASYWFTSPAGNPLAIYEELLRRAPNAECVWILDGKSDPMGLAPGSYVRQGSADYYELLATAKYFVNNVNFPHFLTKREGTIELQTTHGTPLKVMGIHESRAPVSDLNINAMLNRSERWDYCLSPNPYTSEIWRGAYPTNYELLEFGYPRNDILHRHGPDDIVRVRRALGIEPGEVVVLYAPTYRQLKRRRVSPGVDFDKLSQAAGDGVRILNRSHYLVDTPASARGNVIDVSDYPVTNELLLACDVLLTDYSSIMFDFASLRRPIINFVPDCDDYMAERVTYFDIRKKNAGLVTESESELRKMLAERRWESDDVRRSIGAFADEFVGYDDGHSAERVVSRVFADLLND